MAWHCFCSATFTTIEELYEHANSLGHRNQCPCGELFLTRGQWIKHKTSVPHDNPPQFVKLINLMASHRGVHGCLRCGIEFQIKDDRERYVDEVHAPEHECKICRESFVRTPGGIDKHMQQTHRFECKICDMEISRTEEALNWHIADKHPPVTKTENNVPGRE